MSEIRNLERNQYKEIYIAISTIFAGDYYPEEDYLDRDDFQDDNAYEDKIAEMMENDHSFFEEYFGGAQDFFYEGWLESTCMTEEEFRETWKEAAILEKYGFFKNN